MKTAFDMAQNGGSVLSISKIVGRSTVATRAMLMNPIYKGVLTYSVKCGDPYPSKNGKQPSRKRVKRAPEEIISVRVYAPEAQAVPDQVWDAVNAQMTANAKDQRRRTERRNDTAAFSGFLVSELGTPTGTFGLGEHPSHILYAVAPEGRPPRYYCKCHIKDLADKCTLPRFQTEVVDAACVRYLVGFTRSKSVLESLVAQAETPTATPDYGKQIDACKRKLSKLIDLYTNDAIDMAEYKTRKANHEREIAGLREAQAKTERASTVKATVQDLTSRWAFPEAPTNAEIRQWCTRYGVTLIVHPLGISGVSMRIPGLDSPMYVGNGNGVYKWADLAGRNPWDRTPRCLVGTLPKPPRKSKTPASN